MSIVIVNYIIIPALIIYGVWRFWLLISTDYQRGNVLPKKQTLYKRMTTTQPKKQIDESILEYSRNYLQYMRQRDATQRLLLQTTSHNNVAISSSDDPPNTLLPPQQKAVAAMMRDTARLSNNTTPQNVVDKFSKQERIEIVKRIKAGETNYKILKDMFDITKGAKYSTYSAIFNHIRDVLSTKQQ
jgi:hypothetical protein